MTAAEILEWTRTHRNACYLAVTELVGPRPEGKPRGRQEARLVGIHRAAANIDAARETCRRYPDWPPAALGLEFRQLVLAGKLAHWLGRPAEELRWLKELHGGTARALRAALLEDARQRLQEAEHGSNSDD